MFDITSPSLSGLTFFIIIICVGYFATEIFGFSKKESEFESIIRYILRGVFVNLIVFFLILKTPNSLIDLYKVNQELESLSSSIGDLINIFGINITNKDIHGFVFVISYSGIIIILLFLLRFLIWIMETLREIISVKLYDEYDGLLTENNRINIKFRWRNKIECIKQTKGKMCGYVSKLITMVKMKIRALLGKKK